MQQLAEKDTVAIVDGKTTYYVPKHNTEKINKIKASIEARKKEEAERLERVMNLEIRMRKNKRAYHPRSYDLPARPDIIEALPPMARTEVAAKFNISRAVISNILGGRANRSPAVMEILKELETIAALADWGKKSLSAYKIDPITRKYRKQ